MVLGWRGLTLVCVMTLALVLGGCRRVDTPLPTRIPSIEVLATSEFLTAIAPPEGMRERISFPRVDDNLVFVPNWRSETSFRFDGVFTGTPREISAETSLRAWYNQVGNRRRVVIDGSGELFGEDGVPRREGVRLSNSTYLLIDGECYGDGNGDAALLADLRMGDVIGGVDMAIPAGEQRILHGLDVWRYSFVPDALNLPLARLSENSAITGIEGELWAARVSPSQTVVVRYYANVQVDNVVLRLFEASLPVTGTLQIRYDLYDVGIDPNITAPHGC